MKKLFFLGTLIFALSTNSFAYKIISLHKQDKGWFGYKTVNWDLAEYGNNQLGWVGNCQDPGREACAKPTIANEDVNDHSNAQELLSYAEDQIDNENFTGSYTKQVQVEGESFMRVYKVTWNTDNEGNGIIEVERNDV